MSVHYKFKSTLNFDTIAFDGLHISVADLKKAIVSQKRLGKMSDFDLQITNAQTKEEYLDDSTLIPKNTSLIIARIPLAQQPKRSWEAATEKPNPIRSRPKSDNSISLDISKMQGSEEEKIREMMLQSTADYDPKSYQRTKGHYQSGEVPANYRCNKCKKGGHWIKNCPLGSVKEHTEVKRTTGIPRSFRDKDPLQNQETVEHPPIAEIKTTIPEDLLCSICNDLFTDAVMIPCCGSSFCDDCVRTALLESEDNECPDCGEKGSSPGALIPNRFIRNSVNSFRNETGYTTAAPKKDKEKTEIVTADTEKTEEKHIEEVAQLEEEVAQTEEETPIKPTEEENTTSDLTTQSVTEPPVPENTNIAEEDVKDNEIDTEVADDGAEKETPTTQSSSTANIKDETAAPQGEVESDFEDNIVVKMPHSQVENQHAVFRERPYNDSRRVHSVKPVEQEMLQKIPKISPINMNSDTYGSPLPSRNNDWDRKYEHSYKEPNKEMPNLNQIGCIPTYPNPNAKPMHLMPSYPYCDMGQRPPIRPLNMHEMLPDGMNRGNMYPQHNRMIPGQGLPVHGPPIGPFQNPYGQIMTRPTVGYNQFIPPDVRNDCMGYGPPRNMVNDNSHGMPPSNLASVYQGVAEKVGTGIIDDPLEAFNRIMKEKEKRKEARCRSTERHQSRSNDHHHPVRNRFRASPYDYDKPREHYLKERKERSPIERERERDRRGERRDYGGGGRGNERKLEKSSYMSRRRHSNSFSKSRSRSNSLSKKHSISPHKSRSRGYKKTTDEKYHRLDKNRSEQRTQNPRPGKEASPGKPLYDAGIEYQQPPPPGFEVNFSMTSSNSSAWSLAGKRDAEQESTRRRDCTPPRTQKRMALSPQPTKPAERKRLHSRSMSPELPAALAKHEKRDHNRDSVGNEEPFYRSLDNGTQKNKTEKDHHHHHHGDKRSNSEEAKSKVNNEANMVDYKTDKMEKMEDDWHLNDSDRISVDSKKEAKREKSEGKREKKERKKRRKDKMQRKKTKKDKREKQESSDKERSSGKESKKEKHHATPEMPNTLTEDTNKEANCEASLLNSSLDYEPPSATGSADESAADHHISTNGESNNTMTTSQEHAVDFLKEDVNPRKEKENFDGNIGEPELSKWERDEIAGTINSMQAQRKDDDRHTITNEVLRKAENVIFAKAENSIRSLETKTKTGIGSVCERSKGGGGRSPKVPHIGGNAIENIQITVPLIDDHKKRRSRSTELNPSIKERLGSKIVTNSSYMFKGSSNSSSSLKRHGSMDGGEPEERRYRNKFRDPRTPRREVSVRERVGSGGGSGRGSSRSADTKPNMISQQSSSNSAGNRRPQNPRNAFATYDHDSKRKTRDDNGRGDRVHSREGDRERERKSRESRERSYGGSSVAHKTSNNTSSSSKRDTPKHLEEPRGGAKNDRYNRYDSSDRNKNKNESTRQHTAEERPQPPQQQRTFNMDKMSATPTSGSDSDAKSPDTKRKKKHKSKKDKKRAKRSSSVDSSFAGGGSSSKNSRSSKKKLKSNRKNKKNKK